MDRLGGDYTDNSLSVVLKSAIFFSFSFNVNIWFVLFLCTNLSEVLEVGDKGCLYCNLFLLGI